mmetsp:Transcript_3855/g.4708  ORF Transcript_3855/g.4708 Transcript_3855/m.4708 type:complete len:122 (-) Transcript_3855:171-536(-)
MKIKTELCKNWEVFGHCNFGTECAFAHGEQELIVKNHLSKNYKTKRCKQFHEEGYCAYGNRCQFLHLCIQKSAKKLSYHDMLKENLLQNARKMKVAHFVNTGLVFKNHFRTRRLECFKELC